jgi:hypothetical protein
VDATNLSVENYQPVEEEVEETYLFDNTDIS